MKNIAYLRISTDKQDLNSQKLAVMEYAHKEGLTIDRFVEVEISSRKKKQHIDLSMLIDILDAGDLLLVSELSRVGRSISQIISTVDQLVKQGVRFVAIKEGITINGQQDMQSKILTTLFGLFAEIERDLISQRTKEGLANAVSKGKKLGRPKGKKSKSKLDGQATTIAGYLDKGISKASIAKLLDVAPSTLHLFIKTRKIEAGNLLKQMT